MGCVYIAISPSNKKYVGVTSQNINERWKEHTQRARENRKGALYNAIRKYSVDSFMKFTLFESDNWDELCEKEKELIAENNTLYPNGYNLTSGGEGVPGRVITDESRKRMSEGQKKRFQDPKQIELVKIIAENARKITSERWAKIREQKKIEKQAYYQSPEYKKKFSDSVKNGMANPAVREKLLSEAKKRAANPEWRKKMSEAKMGNCVGSKRTDEQKKKMSEARKLWWAKRNANK